MLPSFSVLRQYLLPQHLLSRIVGILANCRWKWFKNWGIRRLIRVYGVNLAEAVSTNLDDYPHFNSFFTRHLRPELRPIAPGDLQLASPVDGTISQIGAIRSDIILQAKRFDYSLLSLLGGSDEWAQRFQNGSFATLYLAPRDYHRVHMPCDGRLKQTIFIPGRLFSVNPLTTNSVPGLFARNERLVCLFESAAGPMAVILVGAMLVGQMRTVWSDAPRSSVITVDHPQGITLKKGDEMAHFLMGSTVILLFGPGGVTWDATLAEESVLKWGQEMGEMREMRENQNPPTA